MPELPEVETVRRGLQPHLTGARIDHVQLNRADLRFAFPADFRQTLTGATIEAVDRRGKYLLLHLDRPATWIVHLGMSGRLSLRGASAVSPGQFYDATPTKPQHDHVIITLSTGGQLIYNDPRRFGFMDLQAQGQTSPHLARMGPEPLSDDFTAQALQAALSPRRGPIKTALLDQSVVAGLGNIYVCEALWRVGVHPERAACDLNGTDVAALQAAVIDVLHQAIVAGGSTLRDHADIHGQAGGYQAHFRVYDQAGQPCPTPRCRGVIARLVQAGRSSFFCPRCQR